jgi:hypothetical protein
VDRFDLRAVHQRDPPTIAEGVHGGWLLAIVATQAVTVLSTVIAPFLQLFWGAVFPLGMHTACTHRRAEVTAAPPIAAIPKVFVKVVLASFIAVVVGTILMMLTTDSFAIAVTGQMILALGIGLASAAVFGCIAKIRKIRPDKLDKMKGRI